MASHTFDKCPTCAKTLPAGSKACPYCGWSSQYDPPPVVINQISNPHQNQKASPNVTATAVIICVVGLAIGLSFSINNPPEPEKPEYDAPSKTPAEIAAIKQEKEQQAIDAAAKEFRINEMVRTGLYSNVQSETLEALKREGAPPLNPWDNLFVPAHDWLDRNLHDPKSTIVSDASRPVRMNANGSIYYKQAATIRARNGFGATVAQRYLFTVYKDGSPAIASPIN